MLSLKPIPESAASRQVAQIYLSIKQTFGLANIPMVFQYLAVFPDYLDYIWQQALKNLHDLEFKTQILEIEHFAQTAIQTVYTPTTLTKLFLEKIQSRAEKFELTKFVTTISQMNASLYLLSLAIRESLKGKYLGIKQIGEHLSEKEKSTFNDLSEGFMTASEIPNEKKADIRVHSGRQLTHSAPTGITVSVFAQFFDILEKEMEKLLKEEKYLTRRVELERFALAKLHLLPHPLESSITTVMKQNADNPKLPELIYLIADLFPTQAPYKLMASAVMNECLKFNPENNKEQKSIFRI